MDLKSPATPRRVYYLSNICVICGFSFVQTDITPSGHKVEKKLTNHKLKLTRERVDNIKKVIEVFEHEHEQVNGVCKKCYRHIEKVLKLQEDLGSLQKDLNDTRSGVRMTYNLTCSKTKSESKRQSYEKRLLRSPLSQQPSKQQRTDFPTAVSVVTMMTLPTFPQILSGRQTDHTVAEIVPTPKKTRRSLSFTSPPKTTASQEEQKHEQSSLVGEVEVQMYMLILYSS